MGWFAELMRIDKRSEGNPVTADRASDVRRDTVRHITAGALKRAGAPKEQVELFGRLFPDGVGVTLGQAFVAVVLGQDLEWFLDGFLSPAERADFKALQEGSRVEYRIAERKAWMNKRRVEWLGLANIVSRGGE